MDKPFEERRKHVRIYRNFVLNYYEKGKSTSKHEISQVNNVSKGGMSFASTYPLKEGTVVMIDFKTFSMIDPIHLEGVVLESKEKVPGLIYETRLQFQEISAQSLSVLEKIERYSKASEG